MKDTLSRLQGKQIAEYNYNYWYLGTTVNHTIREYYQQEKDTRVVVLEKETRKGDLFVKLPHSLWITRDGYPPLVTDAAVKNPQGLKTIYFAAIPTVQSKDHMTIFDDSLRKGLKEMGLDYDLLSKKLKAGELLDNFPITGFAYRKEGTLEPELFNEFEKRVLEAYEQVLESKPHKCPVELFTRYIVGPTAVREYHLFKDEGFDVPFSGQKAFFTMMMEFRSPPVEAE